ncbi:LLM class flavin-dependent oxidoreductase [Bacillus sp. FJAT-44742]|uniref:LLM class flavin-dependent oxidoreductase n=1 Tax=Bacillus sp. FJAT-44742 TaxID=2014005 RepID=UPI000C24F872|nr:LLM class flavin-dependent oxidoreductase [Bacillus sp. FJAT-44742]
MKLGILDQSPISKGESAGQALNHSVLLAQRAEQLGYSRYWVAEHHSTAGLASSSPEILMTHIASNTNRIRVGSGGVLLPQYSPYKVAENFKTMEALFPGRIDLGVGRSPGGGPSIRLALTDGVKKNLIEFPRQLFDLQGFLDSNLPQGHPYKGINTNPVTSTLPETWVLGLSERGAKVAGRNSAGFTYGHFINPYSGAEAVNSYLKSFTPSPRMDNPKVNACVFVVCAESKEEAEELAVSQDHWLLAVEKGGNTQIISIEEAKARLLSDNDKVRIIENRKRAVIGTPEQVKEELLVLSRRYQTNELLIITNIYDKRKRIRSYELLSKAFHLQGKNR